jgi:hypothetical protein
VQGASSLESELLAFRGRRNVRATSAVVVSCRGHERTWRDPISSETWNKLTNSWKVSCLTCKEPDNNQFHIFGFSRLLLSGKRGFSKLIHKK